MASLILHHLDDDLATRLSQRAILHGRSTEEEAQDILRQALISTAHGEAGLGSHIHRRFAAVGGVELPATPPRLFHLRRTSQRLAILRDPT